MSNKRSYLDSINTGRTRRPSPSFDEMDRTLAQLEGRSGSARASSNGTYADEFRAPQRDRHSAMRDDYAPYPHQAAEYQPRRGGERPSFDALARDMERARQQEDGMGSVGKIAAELKAMREELRQQMGLGLRREFDSLRADIERLNKVAPSANPSDLNVEFDRLSDAVRALSERGDDRGVNMLRLELEKVKGTLDSLAREDTLRSVDRRWENFDQRWTNLENKIDNGPSRSHFEPTFRALNAQLERIGSAVDSLPESLSLRSLEDKLRGLAGTVDQFSNRYGTEMPEAFSLIEQRLDEITRAIAASAAATSSPSFDSEPFERIEARVSSLSHQIEELIDDQGSEQVIDRLNALSHRVEEIAQRISMPESAVELLAEQISAIAGKLEEDPSRSYADVIFQGMEDRFAQISNLLERRQGDAMEQGQQLFRELERRLETVATTIDSRDTAAAASNAGVIDAVERRFAELASHLETSGQQPAAAMGADLEQRLDDISRRLEDSAHQVSGIDSGLIKSLESQVAALSAHLQKPSQPLPEFEDISPRLDHIEQALAQGRDAMVAAARQAAQDAVTSLPASASDAGGVSALSGELKVIEQLSRKSDERNAKTFEAIHDTLLKIVDRLGNLEQRPAAAVAATPIPVPAAKAALEANKTPPIQAEFDDELPMAPHDPSALVRSPAQAAAAAATHALGKTVDAVEEPTKRSMLGGLTRAFSGRKDRKAALAGDEVVVNADRTIDPQLDDPLDPGLANQPLEPGSGAPDLNAIMKRVRDEHGQPGQTSSMDAAKSDFIAAARRAAQAAAAEAEAMKRKGDTDSTGRNLGVGNMLKGRSRTALMAATAIVVVIGAMQLGGAFLSGDESPAEIAMDTDAADTTLPMTAEMIPAGENDGDASSARMIDDAADDIMADAAEAPLDDEAMANSEPVTKVAEPEAPRMAAINATPMTMAPPAPKPATVAAAMVPAPAEAGPVALREAADSGNAKAIFEIGNRYAEGRGVKSDMAMAAGWYERSAELDYAPAQYRLGNFYEKGTSVDRDINLAIDWYQRAAKQGNASAMHNLAVLYAMGADGVTDNDRAARWFIEAAELGVKDSQYNLGILAAKGAGMPQSLEESYKWFALVAKSGDRDAIAKRDEVAKALRPEQLEKAKAAAELWKARAVVPEVNVAEIPEEWTEANSQTASVDVTKAVRNIQAILNKNGYDAGPADGVMGGRTKSAIQAFQSDNAMTADGEVSEALVKALLEKN